jgi:hypothetical protein
MKFSLRPGDQAEDDRFGPLRELRSPVTTDSIKIIVLDRMASGYSIWSQLRGLIGEFLAVGVVAAIVINFSGFRPAETTSNVNAEIGKVIAASNLGLPDASVSHFAGVRSIHSHLSILNLPGSLAGSSAPLLDSDAKIFPVSNFRVANEIPAVNGNEAYAYQLQTEPPIAVQESGIEWFSTLSSGAVFSHIRMLSEDAEVGIQNGWKSVGISLSNANGNRDMHDVLEHHASASSLLFSENDQTIALLLGASFSLGPVTGKAELGPAYLFSSITYVDPATMALGPSATASRLRATAKVSVFYNISDFFQAGVTGISSYQTGQYTNGVFISISIKP